MEKPVKEESLQSQYRSKAVMSFLYFSGIGLLLSFVTLTLGSAFSKRSGVEDLRSAPNILFIKSVNILFIVSSIRFWLLHNSKNAILKLGEKIGRAPLTISGSQTLFFVSIVSSLIRLLGVLVYLTIYSVPDMKNARHFQSCPNLCNKSMFL